jgi:hypothetical protein
MRQPKIKNIFSNVLACRGAFYSSMLAERKSGLRFEIVKFDKLPKNIIFTSNGLKIMPYKARAYELYCFMFSVEKSHECVL